MRPDPTAIPARLANRLLHEHSWARARLAPLAGRTFSLTVGPMHAAWRITDDGTLDVAPAAPEPDLKLAVSPWSLPAFLANPARWNEFVREDGDATLGGALKEVAQTLPWFVEASFAKALGPIAGQRAADAGRSLLGFPEYAAQRVTESVVSYARDEADLLARGADMRRFIASVSETVDRTEALATRVDALAPRVQPIR